MTVFSGVAIAPATCILLADFISYILVVIVVIISSVALGIICKVRRDLKAVQDRLKNKRATSWGRVQEMMKKKEASSGVSQKPPFPTKTGWGNWHFRIYVFMLFSNACKLFVWNKSTDLCSFFYSVDNIFLFVLVLNVWLVLKDDRLYYWHRYVDCERLALVF